MKVLNLIAVPLDGHGEPATDSWLMHSISIRIGEHEIGRVENLSFYGGNVDVEAEAATWLCGRLAR
jgi:hypothetical protein